MALLRRIVAALILALVTWHGAGLATAFEYDPIVHCCCGDHDADHKCGCKHCPGAGAIRLRQPRSADEDSSPVPMFRPCAGRRMLAAIPTLPEWTLPTAAEFAAADATGHVSWPLPPPLASHVALAERPPP